MKVVPQAASSGPNANPHAIPSSSDQPVPTNAEFISRFAVLLYGAPSQWPLPQEVKQPRELAAASDCAMLEETADCNGDVNRLSEFPCAPWNRVDLMAESTSSETPTPSPSSESPTPSL